MTMLEQETDSILATLTARTIGERDAILLQEILAADLPRGIKTYLQAETVRLLEAELFASPGFSRVDRRAPGVLKQERAFIATMSTTYSFPRAEYLTLLENAIHFLENYLCRPQWTIENFVFEAGPRQSAEYVMAKLDCTVDYAYFRTLIRKVMQRRGTTAISSEEFRTILVRIDDQIVKQHNARELALLAKPIFDFLLLRDTPPDISIPLKPILVFFEDKKMSILRDYIESICRIRQRSEITLDELTTLVEDLYLGQTAPGPAPAAPARNEPPAAAVMEESPAAAPNEPPQAAAPVEAPAADVKEESERAEEETGPRQADAAPQQAEPEERGAPEPVTPPAEDPGMSLPTIEIESTSIFDFVTEEPDGRDDEPPPDEPRRTSPPPAPRHAPPARHEAPPRQQAPPHAGTPAQRDTPAHRAPEPPKPVQPEKPRVPEPYERLFAGAEPPEALTDLRELIVGHTRTRFVKRIFDRDEEKYEDFISALNNSGTWREASLLLNSLYMANRLDPFDPDVVEFTDAIHRRYMDAERDGA